MANTQKTESALLSKVWNIANVLSAAGVGFTDYITQLTYILFLKMDDEKESMGLPSYLPEGCKWKDLTALNGDDLVTKDEEILKELRCRILSAVTQMNDFRNILHHIDYFHLIIKLNTLLRVVTEADGLTDINCSIIDR